MKLQAAARLPIDRTILFPKVIQVIVMVVLGLMIMQPLPVNGQSGKAKDEMLKKIKNNADNFWAVCTDKDPGKAKQAACQNLLDDIFKVFKEEGKFRETVRKSVIFYSTAAGDPAKTSCYAYIPKATVNDINSRITVKENPPKIKTPPKPDSKPISNPASDVLRKPKPHDSPASISDALPCESLVQTSLDSLTINQMRNITDYQNMIIFLYSLQNEGKIIFYDKKNKFDCPQYAYLVVYDTQTKAILSILDKEKSGSRRVFKTVNAGRHFELETKNINKIWISNQ
ncbi:MAG: hypothetical protein WCK34_00780 [Bacteroidota bacterium]